MNYVIVGRPGYELSHAVYSYATPEFNPKTATFISYAYSLREAKDIIERDKKQGKTVYQEMAGHEILPDLRIVVNP